MRYTVTEQGRWPDEFKWPTKHQIWFIASICILFFCLIVAAALGASGGNSNLEMLISSLSFPFTFGSLISAIIAYVSIEDLQSTHEQNKRMLQALLDGPKSLQEIDAKFKPDTTDWTRTKLNELIVKGLVRPVNNG